MVVMDNREGDQETLKENTKGVICIIPIENKAVESMEREAWELRKELLGEAINAIVRWDDGYASSESAKSKRLLPSSIDTNQLPMMIFCNYKTGEPDYSGDNIPMSLSFLRQYMEELACTNPHVDLSKIRITPGLAKYINDVMNPNNNFVTNYHDVKPDYLKGIASRESLSFAEARYYHGGGVKGARYNLQTSTWEFAIEYQIRLQDSPTIWNSGVIYVPIVNWVSPTRYTTANTLVKAFVIVACMSDIYHEYLLAGRSPSRIQIEKWKSAIRVWNLPTSWRQDIRYELGRNINIWAEILSLYYQYSK
nr:hypothetical protein [Candidatus Sigynarchaeum springense]